MSRNHLAGTHKPWTYTQARAYTCNKTFFKLSWPWIDAEGPRNMKTDIRTKNIDLVTDLCNHKRSKKERRKQNIKEAK